MRTILIIEDDQMLSDMYTDKFQLDHFAVLTAKDGEHGLTLALKEKPHMILLDIALPKMDGLEVMKKIRADVWGKSVPIIVLTNLNVDGKVIDGVMHYEPAYCLLKANTTPEELLQKANVILKHE
jgi:DNA-binding response OmpR family regulator